MSERTTESLVRDLTRDLQPVRRLPGSSATLWITVGVWAATIALHTAFGFPGPDFADPVWREPVFLAVLLGLAVAGGAVTMAAVSGAVPGLDVTARVASATGAVAVVLALAVAAAAAAGVSDGFAGEAVVTSAWCVRRAALLALLPAPAVAGFIAWAADRRALRGGWLAAFGCAALAAAFVHASCPVGDPLHTLLGHGLSPGLVGLAFAVPLALLIRAAAWRTPQ